MKPEVAVSVADSVSVCFFVVCFFLNKMRTVTPIGGPVLR